MIFTAGVGASLIYWGIGEPMYYLQSPPLFAEPNSYAGSSLVCYLFYFSLGRGLAGPFTAFRQSRLRTRFTYKKNVL